MTTYTLLAHRINGKQALVQHDDQPHAYLYDFTPRVFSKLFPWFGPHRKYRSVGLEYEVQPEEWVTEFDDNAPRFTNADTMHTWLEEATEVYA